MVARFKARSESGPIIVAVFDPDDAESIANKEPKTMWNVSMNPGRDLGMRFLLSPVDGFEPSHTYLMQVVQLQGARERVLAEGTVHLE